MTAPGSRPAGGEPPTILQAMGLTADEEAALQAEHFAWAQENRRRQREALEAAANWQMP